MLIALMTVSTVLIAYLIYRQNRETAFSMLGHGIEIIKESLEAKSDKLHTDTAQITGNDSIIQNLDSLIAMHKDNVSQGEIDFMHKELSQYLYEQARATLIWKSLLYSSDGDLIGFLINRENEVIVGFPDQGRYQVALIKQDEALEYNSWKTVDTFEGVEEVVMTHSSVQSEGKQLYVSGTSVAILSATKFRANRYNEVTEQNESIVIADFLSFHRIDSKEVQQLSKLTGAQVNFFVDNRLSTGSLPSYQKVQAGSFPDRPEHWELTRQKAVYGEVDVQGDDFFQAVFPIYDNQKHLGYVAALFQADLAMQNTWQIIKALFLIAIVGIVVFSLLIFFLAAKVSRPLENMADIMDETRSTGDFSNRVRVLSQDEIGMTGLAYNELMETLQTAIDGINVIMEAVSAGDLSNMLEGHFKGDVSRLQSSINRALEMLGSTVIQVVDVSDHVHSSSVELKNAAQNLANGTSQQAASLEEISSSMAEVRQSASQNRDYAETALNLIGKTIDTVSSGNQKMDDMLQSMNRIHGTTLQVSQVIKVIDEIAFQTNLLALNAAVEAARAGKYGKGFAIVAEEVRRLAGRSAEAAKNTNELIDNATGQVETGVNKADETADAMDKITEVVHEVKSLIDQIEVASKHQQSGTEEINKGLDLINTVVQQNSAISEETSSAASVLSSHAEKLQQLMKQFQVKHRDVRFDQKQGSAISGHLTVTPLETE